MSSYGLKKIGHPTIHLPPDQSFRVYSRNNQLLVFSVAPDGVSIGKGSTFGTSWSSSPDGFHIFAEQIKLSDSFRLEISSSSSVMTLSTHSMQLSDQAASTADVSGKHGTNNETGGMPDSSIHGQSAGRLAVYVESCDAISVNTLILCARGGHGGDTRQAAGKAGDGGDGGLIQFLAYSSRLDLCQRLYQIAANKTYNDKMMLSITLTPETPLASDLREAVDMARRLKDWDAISSILQPVEHTIMQISTNTPPTHDEALDIAFDAGRALEIQALDEEANLRARATVSGGHGGSTEPPLDGGPRGLPGDKGNSGESKDMHNMIKLDPVLLRTCTAVFVHSDQCQMLFDRAMTYWYFGYYDPAIELLRRLLIRFAFLPLQETDQLYQAYAEQEESLRCPGSIEKLNDLRRTSMTQLCALTVGGTDFYGYKENWVPRLSYTTYQNYLDSAMKIFRQLERSYIAYNAALEEQQDVKEAVNSTKANIDNSLRDLDEEIQTLAEECKKLDTIICISGPEVEELHREFLKAYDVFKNQIEQSHYLETREVVNAVVDIIASPRARTMTAASTAVKMQYDWSNLAETNHVGAPVTKKYLLDTLQRSTVTSRQDFTADFSKDELSGEFSVDGRADKFVIEKELLEQVLMEFSGTQFAPLGDELLEKFEVFIDALEERNEDILAYNNILQAILDRIARKEQLEKMKVTAEKGVLIGEDLERMTDYMRFIYDNARARVMRYISMGQRALTFKILKKEDLLELSGVDINGDIPLSVTSDVLAVVRSNLEDLLLRATEENSNAPADFPATANGTGKRRYLTEYELNAFLKEKRIQLAIPPVFPDQLTNVLNHEFTGTANVRVYRVKFVLSRLRATAIANGGSKRALCRAEITHAGRETIVSRRGVANKFEHDRLTTLYSYACDEDGATQEQDDGRLVNKPSLDDRDSTFGAPGPFTTWTVDAQRSDWDGLDVGLVDGAFLEFEGANYAFL